MGGKRRGRDAAAPRPSAFAVASEDLADGRAGRAENDTPKTAFEVHVGVRRIKTSPTLTGPVVTYSKSLYLHVRLVPRTRGRARLVRKPVNSKLF